MGSPSSTTSTPAVARGPVVARATRDRGELDRADVQGLVGSGYGRLPEARFVGVRIDDEAAGRALLSRLLPQVTSTSGTHAARALNLAITHTGLAHLGLPRPALELFSLEFTGGMATPSRSAFLGDAGEHDPAGWAWGGPRNPRVDILLLLYAATTVELDSVHEDVRSAAGTDGVAEVAVLATSTLTPHDHHGFADGISQPAVAGLHGNAQDGDVALGEFLLGHPNAYGRYTSRPLLPATADPGGLLPSAPDARDKVDLGRNGTYLVVRTLAQDVAAFREHVDRWAARTGLPRDLVAAKIVGRWRSGTSLTVSPEVDVPAGPVDNSFRYHRDGDALGLGCPVAAHVRRANPRDSLDPCPGSDASLKVNNRHRLIRRGRQYGPAAQDGGDAERGLHFLCLNANISRQFEFVQHTWLNNPAFAGLQDSPDPLVGAHAPGTGLFPVPAVPVRHRLLGLPTFTRVRGGTYAFMPGLRALAYLAAGPWAQEAVPRPRDG
ncbi:Dyp-type peroxidase [Geodermatophilus sp. CPCC 205761]|uniref:Dyp-type peroxidase n=1 Tax=Geodermatophilus sp. CPCC 205761 TaxID=2936597 RepID=UPI003EEC7FDC